MPVHPVHPLASGERRDGADGSDIKHSVRQLHEHKGTAVPCVHGVLPEPHLLARPNEPNETEGLAATNRANRENNLGSKETRQPNPSVLARDGNQFTRPPIRGETRLDATSNTDVTRLAFG